jgi:GNAT superfamily N-acetyltransferase
MRICWQSELQFDLGRMTELLQEFGDLLSDPLSERIDLCAYAEKILAHADIAFAFIDEKIAGMIVFYANNTETRVARVTLLVVAPFARRKGVSAALMSRAMALARQRKMLFLEARPFKSNSVAIATYHNLGLMCVSQEEERVVLQVKLTPASDPASAESNGEGS